MREEGCVRFKRGKTGIVENICFVCVHGMLCMRAVFQTFELATVTKTAM